MKYSALPVTILVLVALAACSTPPAKPLRTHYGESAVTLANHIKGCHGVVRADIGAGAKAGMASSATCRLAGRKVVIDSWNDASSADMTALMAANKTERYWAEGVGWSAFDADDSQIQLQLTNDAAALLKSAFENSQPTPDVNGEQAAAKSVAKSLNGLVRHYTP